MFDKYAFSKIIKDINATYSSQIEFSKKAKIGRTYLSQYMNCKYDKPPKETILKKLDVASNGITSYKELCYICGYLPAQDYIFINNFSKIFDSYKSQLKALKISDEMIRVLYLTLIGDYSNKNLYDFSTYIINTLSNNELKVYQNIMSNIFNAVQENQKIINDIIDMEFDKIQNELDNALEIIDQKIDAFENKSDK